jgi:very-short-patch-repair endonuclease
MADQTARDRESGPKARLNATTPATKGGCSRHAAVFADKREHVVRLVGVPANIRVSGRPDARAAAIAGAQRGVVSRAQLRAAGVSDDAVDRRFADGRLIRLFPGVFALGHASLPALGLETAALLSVGEGAVLSHFSAADIWQLFEAPADRGDVHVLVGERTVHARAGIRVHHSRTLRQGDIRIQHGLPVTSPARTLLDLADVAPVRRLEKALSEAVAHHLTSELQLRRMLAVAKGRHGAPRLAALLDGARRTRTRSGGEAELLAFMRAAELPLPVFNARVHGWEVDCFWPDHGLVLEFDSWRFHSSRGAFEYDRRKGAALTAAGLRVMRGTWRQLEDEPLATAVRIAQALAVTR